MFSYRPLFSWAGVYFTQIQLPPLDSRSLHERVARAQPVFLHAQRQVAGVPDAWLQLSFVPLAPPVCNAMLVDQTRGAAIDHLDVLSGPFVYGVQQWRALTVDVQVHSMRAGPSAAVRRYGNKQEAGRHWLTDTTVRAAYDAWPAEQCTAVVSAAGETIVELPELLTISPPPLRQAALEQLKSGVLQLFQQVASTAVRIGVSTQPLAVRAEKHDSIHALLTKYVDLVACTDGAITAAKQDHRAPTAARALVVERFIGDRCDMVLTDGGKAAQTVACMRTHVRGPEYQGLVWLRPEAPATVPDIRTFNDRVVRFPHRLFSYEIRRVQTTLRALERLPGPAEIEVQKNTETNVVLTANSDNRYYCIDAVEACFTPVPHIWR